MKLTGGGGGGEMNKRSLEVMLELARAVAVANLRPQITVTDAALAILLYDNTLLGRNGHSILRSGGSVSHHKHVLDRYSGGTTQEKLGELAAYITSIVGRYV